MGDVKNIPASVSERLRNIAKHSGKAFDTILFLYLHERFLHRLSISEFRENFVLKGGLYLFLLTQLKSRPTKDMDFLARRISNDLEHIKIVVEKICGLSVEDDGVHYDVIKMTVERIKQDADYEGVRIKIPTFLGQIRKILQLDIGFGDVIIPKPQDVDYPVLLDMASINIQAYSTESVIAEKFEAMITLSLINSRMKDFYDIYSLLVTENFDGRVLMEAVHETFQRRGTNLAKEHPVFSEAFATDPSRRKQWINFLQRIGVAESPDFEEVMWAITKFLLPIYHAIVTEKEFFNHWYCQSREWRI